MKIDAGKLDRKCQLSKPVTSREAANGEAVETFSVVATRYCRMLSLLPKEVELQAQLSTQAEAKILMRHDSLTRTIDTTWRVTTEPGTPEERSFEVTGTDPNQRDGSMLVYLAGAH